MLFRTSASASSLSSPPQWSWSLTDPPKEHPKLDGTTSTMRSGTCVLCCPSAKRTRSACPTCTLWQHSAPTLGSLFSFRVIPHVSVPLQLHLNIFNLLKQNIAAPQGWNFRWKLPSWRAAPHLTRVKHFSLRTRSWWKIILLHPIPSLSSGFAWLYPGHHHPGEACLCVRKCVWLSRPFPGESVESTCTIQSREFESETRWLLFRSMCFKVTLSVTW